jgi:hypothetical protein
MKLKNGVSRNEAVEIWSLIGSFEMEFKIFLRGGFSRRFWNVFLGFDENIF